MGWPLRNTAIEIYRVPDSNLETSSATWTAGESMNDELSHGAAQDILARIRRLEPQQLAEVIDFIDFLAQRKFKRPPLVQFLNETSGAGIGLEEVRPEEPPEVTEEN
jgi:hypothetical protein